MMSHPEESPERQYRSALAAGVFQIQHCMACERTVFPPRVACPHCGGGGLSWKKASPNGTVYSSTTISRRAEHGGDYNVVLVDLDDGVRLMSTVAGFSGRDVPIGLKVRARIEADNDFRLVFDAAGATP